jgi:hypothetical protein
MVDAKNKNQLMWTRGTSDGDHLPGSTYYNTLSALWNSTGDTVGEVGEVGAESAEGALAGGVVAPATFLFLPYNKQGSNDTLVVLEAVQAIVQVLC